MIISGVSPTTISRAAVKKYKVAGAPTAMIAPSQILAEGRLKNRGITKAISKLIVRRLTTLCLNPLRNHPYFTSGRLLTGALIPFAVVYVYGLDFLFRKLRAFFPLMIIAAIMIWVTVASFFLHRAIFASAYNWFHR
jgi:hypothetical protein